MHFERQNAIKMHKITFFSENNIILCILKGQMPFKMHKITFFPEKKLCAFLLHIFIPVTRNILF